MLGAVWAHPETEKAACSFVLRKPHHTWKLAARLQAALPSPYLTTFISLHPACLKIWAVTAPEDIASAELWWVHAFLFREMQIRLVCPDSFSTLSLSIYGKQNYMERLKGQKCQVLIPEYRHFTLSPCHVMHVPAGQAVQAAVPQ